MEQCEKEYIDEHSDNILDEFERVIKEENVEQSKLCYTLTSRIVDGSLKPLEVFEKHITECGLNTAKELIPGASKDPSVYIESLLSLRTRFFKFSQDSFDSEPAFEAAIDKAFRFIFNSSQAVQFPYPETFSKYCDMIMKKGSKSTLTETESEQKIINLMDLFMYIDEKDIFQKFYSRSLAKRLIMQTSISLEIELAILSKLKEICGYEFTSKMQRMFTDTTLSSELAADFKKLTAEKLKFEFNVQVLTTGSWPIPNDTFDNYRFPLQIEKGITEFNSFYADRMGISRKLTWNHLFSRGLFCH
jgi:hypothetical protein